MKRLIALLVLLAALVVLSSCNWTDNNTDNNTLELATSALYVHPPETIQFSSNEGSFPTGTVFEYFINDTPIYLPSVEVTEWPAVIRGTAYYHGTSSTDQLSLKLLNSPPVFNSINFGEFLNSKQKTAFHLLFRTRGCNHVGNPLYLRGISDPDFNTLTTFSDQTDGWKYRVEILSSSGEREAVYTQEGGIHILTNGEWVSDPRFVWIPNHGQNDVPPFDIGPLDFGINWNPSITSMSVEEFATKPLCDGGPPATPSLSRTRTHRARIFVLEYGIEYVATYDLFVAESACL